MSATQALPAATMAALFASPAAAGEAGTGVMNSAGLREAQVRLLTPADATLTHREMLERAHPAAQPEWQRSPPDSGAELGWVLAGGLVAIAVWWATRHQPLLLDWPLMSLIVLAALGGLAGLAIQQALNRRRGSPKVLRQVQRGLQAGRWGVIFYPEDAQQTDAIRAALQVRSAECYSSRDPGGKQSGPGRKSSRGQG